MDSHDERDAFFRTWDMEAEQTVRLLDALPADQYDFRPDPKGRSLGELAWHLAEIDAYIGQGAAQGRIDFSTKLAGLERPREVKALAPGYRRVHDESVKLASKLTAADFDRTMPFFGGRELPISRILWSALLYHQIHHRGQLAMLCRLAGGTPPGLYGPNREEFAALQANAARA